MYPEVVFVDATVLVTRSTRDWLLHVRSVSNRGMYVIACSRDVVIEALNTLRNQNPTWSGAQTAALHDGFLKAFDIVDDFDAEIPYDGTDPHDRHVHAAAIASGAGFLLTDDKGFRRMANDGTPYEVISADDFFVLIDDSNPHLIAEATRNQVDYWTSRNQKAQLAEHLTAAGCPLFAERVAGHVRVLEGMMTRAERRRALDKNEQ